MLGFIYRLVLAINATSWMIVIYGIKTEWDFLGGNCFFTSIILLCIPVILSFLSILLSKSFSLIEDQLITCKSIQLADSEYLPVYLGYFFVALSIPSIYSLVFVFFIVLVFSFLSQAYYFNPIFLLLGFHYYHVVTGEGTRIFVIAHGKIIRSLKEIYFNTLRRINDTTFISGREKESA